MDKYLGKRLDGRYEIKEILGIGGMAVVYKAYDNVDNKIVAVKILKEEFSENDEFLRRFKNESKAIAVLAHPNLVKVFDVSFGDLIQYIVMEYIEGITLKEYIERNGPLGWNESVHFTLQILRGLQHAHDKGVVHRDVKPQNIMVLEDGSIKVTDFGIARFARSEQKTITDKAIGSVHYISPEQARGEKTDEKADVYSVGVMLYEMLTGRLPFQAESAVSVAIMQLQKDPTLPRDINGSIPLGLEQITMHAMQKETSRRYRTASEMLCDLEAFKKNPAITFDYDYFVDNSPTRYIPDTNIEKNEEKKEKSEKKSSIIPILAGITSVFVIAVIVLLVFVFKAFTTGTESVKVPDFTGMNYKEVVKDKKYDGLFRFEVQPAVYSDKAVDEIVDQDPEAGGNVKKGATIKITPSQGEKTVRIPNIYGYNKLKAKTALEGFEVEFVEEPNEDVAVGCVIKTDPMVDSSVSAGSRITVYLSTGPEKEFVEVPVLISFSKDSYKDELLGRGLTVGNVTEEYSDTMEKGFVCGVSHEAGAKIEKGTAVDIIISKGPNPVRTFTLELPKYSDKDFVDSVALYDGTREVFNSGLGELDFSEGSIKDYKFEEVNLGSIPKTLTVKYVVGDDDFEVMKIKLEIKNGEFKVTKVN